MKSPLPRFAGSFDLRFLSSSSFLAAPPGAPAWCLCCCLQPAVLPQHILAVHILTSHVPHKPLWDNAAEAPLTLRAAFSWGFSISGVTPTGQEPPHSLQTFPITANPSTSVTGLGTRLCPLHYGMATSDGDVPQCGAGGSHSACLRVNPCRCSTDGLWAPGPPASVSLLQLLPHVWG